MTSQAAPRRKLIEVSLPLEDINRESAREKSIRHGHPSTLHLWWAPRPLASARAILFSQLVDDPSSHPEDFPTDQDQALERERLHDIVRQLVKWENAKDERLLRQARAEIMRSTGGNPPDILDPFAGGGAIPLEAQRLGLRAYASDLNPVAALINKSLIEIPQRFALLPPVFPGAAEAKLGAWPGVTGLAEDVRRYGQWIHERAVERIGHLYPLAKLVDGSEAPVVAWIWARTVVCPNPACQIEMPLVRSWWLRDKKGKEAYAIPVIVNDDSVNSGRRVEYQIGRGVSASTPVRDGTINRSGATCVACGGLVDSKYLRSEGRAKRMGAHLMAVVAQGNRQRVYLPPSVEHEEAARCARPLDAPEGEVAVNPRWFSTPSFGMETFSDLFTNRQLTSLMTFSDLIFEARGQVCADALAAGLLVGEGLESKAGTDAQSYADAVATYLAFALSKMADRGSSLVSWVIQRESTRNTFSRQALPMVWDFVEANTLLSGTGSYSGAVAWTVESLDAVVTDGGIGRADQADAASREYSGYLIATDPPYYDNIGYSDLSDFFYVWLRRTLREIYPSLFATMLVPKNEELVANPYRHGGKDGASEFFEAGFEAVFRKARASAIEDFPITVYYAFKQAELESEGVASTGWATLLEGMIRAGWSITATWPVRSERSGRMISVGTNALASSIVLALRPRHVLAQATSRRGFLAALKAELPQALAEMRQGAIAPVDLAQSTIGPGMAVFSRYSKVVEPDGSAMSVKTALALINQSLDEILAEVDGDLDADTRFCLDWYRQNGWSEKPYGDADVLARARNTSVDGLARGGVLTSKANRVRLLAPGDLDPTWDPVVDDRISLWEATMHLARVLDSQGVDAAAELMAKVGQRVELDAVQMLAYRLYELAQASRPQDALLFNGLGTSWSDLSAVARRAPVAAVPSQTAMDFGEID